MKPSDSIGRIGDSSAFGPRGASFRFRSILFPVERIVPIATTFLLLSSFSLSLPFLSSVYAINFSSSSFPLLLPGEESRESTAVKSRSQCAYRTVDARRVVNPTYLPRLINSTMRNKGLRHNKTRCLRIARLTSPGSGKFRDACNAL